MASKDTQFCSKTIVLPVEESEYPRFVTDNEYARSLIRSYWLRYPELFPSAEPNFSLHGRTPKSKKLDQLQLRRIETPSGVYRIRPSFIMSYFRGHVERDHLSEAMFLRKFGVPYWALAYLYGRDNQYYYRAELSLGRASVVGTTVKSPELLPEDILSDEKHITQRGEKAYAATTIGGGCFLGIEVVSSASEADLTQAYGVFAQEARAIKPDYEPRSVNVDGWGATQAAWKAIFSTVMIIECILHAFLKIRDRATKAQQATFEQIRERFWEAYHAPDRRTFSQRLRRIAEWIPQLDPSPMVENLQKFVNKAPKWRKHFQCPTAHRTSNALDRLMRFMDKRLQDHQGFKGKTMERTTQNYRAMAMIYNFAPLAPQPDNKQHKTQTPFERLNGKSYHQDWLQNLLVASSLAQRPNQPKAT